MRKEISAPADAVPVECAETETPAEPEKGETVDAPLLITNILQRVSPPFGIWTRKCVRSAIPECSDAPESETEKPQLSEDVEPVQEIMDVIEEPEIVEGDSFR